MVSVETLSGLERRIQVSVPATRVRQQVDARLLKVSRTARIKGFRPGKAPIHVVRKHYGPQVRDEVVSDLIRETFAEALRQEELQPAGGPRIEPQKTDQLDDLRYTATFEVYPQFELKSAAAMRLTRPVAAVADADLDVMIESLRKQRPDWSEVTRGCQDADRITLDFAPERFHQLRLQDAGRLVEVRERTVYMKDVSPASLRAIAGEYWVETVARWEGP